MVRQFHLFGLPKIADQTDVKAVRLNSPSLLLIYLAVKGDWVSRSELAFLFRPDDDEVTALKHIRLLLYRAKKLAWAEGLETDVKRARFAVPTDVADFKRALQARNWFEATKLYSQPLLADYSDPHLPTYTAWLELERTELGSAYRSALEHYADDLTAQDNYAGAAEVLEDLLKLDDLAEDVLQAYLKALHASGQREKALKVYRQFAEALEREYDAEPLEETQALIQALRERQPFDRAVVAQQRVVALTPEPIINLPQPSTHFVGRKKELHELSRQLGDENCRLLTLVGLGGSGKTRLALELARSLQDSFKDGVCFVPLTTLTSVDALPATVAQALNMVLAPNESPKEQLIRYLHDKALLLVLDNAEHLSGIGPILHELLDDTVAVKLLMTSRESLRLSNEWLFDVEGLAYPEGPVIEGDGPVVDRATVEAYESVMLFMNSARRVVPRLVVSDDDIMHVARISQRLEGLPLALELAASWARIMPIARIAQELSESYDLLDAQYSDLPERHRNLKAIFERTWSGLSEKKRDVLARFSVLLGSCSLEAAEAVTGAHFSMLLSLVNESLLKRSMGGRLELHSLIRQYLAAKVSESVRTDTVDALCTFFAQFAQEREDVLFERDEKRIVAELAIEATHLHVVWQTCAEQQWLTRLKRLMGAYHFLLDTKGWYQQGASMFCLAVQQLEEISASDEYDMLLPQLLARAGYHSFRAGDAAKARQLLERSLQLLQGREAPLEEGFAEHYLGVLAFSAGHTAEAQQRYRRALACYEHANDRRAKSRTENNLGVLADIMGHDEEALYWYERALLSSRAVGNLRGVASALMNLGVVFETLGKLDAASEHYHQGLAVYREVGDVRGEGAALTNLGHLAERRGEDLAAKSFYEQSLTLKRTIGDPIVTAVSLTNLGDVVLKLGEPAQALVCWQEALALCLRAGALPYALRNIWSYAKYHAAQQRWDLTIYLITFLLRCSESEAWVQQEAREALERWKQHLTPEQLETLQRAAEQVSFERLSQEVTQPNFAL